MPDGFSSALAAVFNALLLVGGVYIYLALIRQIAKRESAGNEDVEPAFGLPDAVLAVALAALFGLNAFASFSAQNRTLVLETNDLIANALVSVALLLFVAAFLRFRGRSVNALGGFSRLGFWRTFMTGAILLFAAYPLIFLADVVTRRVLGAPSSRQSIVELFNDSQTIEQRALIIVLAIAIAPIVEEFVFRFFFYGVAKRYMGRFLGLLANALLFAVVHAHLPSAVPLFVLGICFTLAYEWSGSILVPMAMHALFNSLTLTALAFPEAFPQ